jgi:methionyl aminopeptidase
MIVRKSAKELEQMGRAGTIVAATLSLLGENVRPGTTTGELDRIADQFIRSKGGVPTFKGYRGPYPYPASICASPNDVVVHGIPNGYALAEGDILSVDVGVTLDGFVADSAYTFPVGEIHPEAERLLEVCNAALHAGIQQARAGGKLTDISHEDPQIPNYGEPGRGPTLAPGMTLAIEPMITSGGHEVVVRDDKWTIATADGSLSAHFEHTVAITDEGPVILTAAPARQGADSAAPTRRGRVGLADSVGKGALLPFSGSA